MHHGRKQETHVAEMEKGKQSWKGSTRREEAAFATEVSGLPQWSLLVFARSARSPSEVAIYLGAAEHRRISQEKSPAVASLLDLTISLVLREVIKTTLTSRLTVSDH